MTCHVETIHIMTYRHIDIQYRGSDHEPTVFVIVKAAMRMMCSAKPRTYSSLVPRPPPRFFSTATRKSLGKDLGTRLNLQCTAAD